MLFDIFTNTNTNTIVFECRRCGTTLESEADTCPYCGPTDVAKYEIR